MERRQFLLSTVKGCVLAPLGSIVAARLTFAQGAPAAAPAAGAPQAPGAMPTKLVDPAADPVAKALKYVHDATKAPERTAERTAVAAKDQFCHNCALFVKGPDVDKTPAGKCTLIQSGLVNANGWCMSWAKKQ